MTLRVKFDEHEYEIKILAKSIGYLQLISRVPADIIEAEKLGEAIDKVLDICVTPRPCPNHEVDVFAAILEAYTDKLKKSFRA